MAEHLTITRKQVLRYTLLPEIWPRLKSFFGTGFHHLSYLIAMVFYTVRILPENHPYLQPENFGTYTITQVLRQAWHSIEPSRRNIDQIIVFFTIIVGLVMLVIQFLLMLIAILTTPAKAADMPTSYSGFFKTPNPSEDLAFRMLDMIFGVPGIFNSKEMTGTAQPFHDGLHALLEFYSYGLLAVGIIILLYFVVVVVAETAQSGTPFGKRFNHTWAPIRIVLFFALLIPISNGLNGGQYLTLAIAKAGSGLATNGWLIFVKEIGNSTPLGETDELIYVPEYPNIDMLPAYIMLTRTCAWAYGSRGDALGLETGDKIDAYVLTDGGGVAKKLSETDFQAVAESTNGGNVYIRFGVKDADKYKNENGNVMPFCGELMLYTSDIEQPGSAIIQQGYYDIVRCLWEGNGGTTSCEDQGLDEMGKYFARPLINPPPDIPEPLNSQRGTIVQDLNNVMREIADDAVEAQAEQGNWELEQPVKDLGWVGAAIWYNKIAEQNGALMNALRMVPTISQMPLIMEKVSNEKQKQEKFLLDENRYDPQTTPGKPELVTAIEKPVATVLNDSYIFWTLDTIKDTGAQKKRAPTGNIIIDLINLLLGTSGLFDMCKNADVHPLAQLSGVGKALIDSSIRNLFGAALVGGLGVANSLTGLLSPMITQAGFAAASFMMTFAGIGMMVGFILFYLLPMMPFIYFFFAVGGWIKCLFEAMVGVPLWALAHIRIDGDGLPGSAANAGYFMLLEVFIRPLMIVLGLLAAIGIFGAMVKVLNDIFYLVLANMGGHTPDQSVCFTDANTAAGGSGDGSGGGGSDLTSLARGPIDEFFFTVVYAIIVYLIGMSCFKLIDAIPNNMMRWMSESVEGFNDNRGDPAAGLMQKVAIGGAGIGGKLGSGFSGMGSAFQNVLK